MPRHLALALLLAAPACAGVRPPPAPAAPLPPPPPSALAALLLEADGLGLDGPRIARLEVASRRLDEATAAERREVEAALRAAEQPTSGQRHGPPGGAAGSIGPGAAGPDAGGTNPGGRAHGAGGRGGPGGRGHGVEPAGLRAGVGQHVAAVLQRIEDAEMAAYLEAEGGLPAPLRERCREVVARQRERLLTRHEAIRARLGAAE